MSSRRIELAFLRDVEKAARKYLSQRPSDVRKHTFEEAGVDDGCWLCLLNDSLAKLDAHRKAQGESK